MYAIRSYYVLFVTPSLAREQTVWGKMGYEHRSPETLSVLAWQEAARESMPEGTILFFKQLRTDRVITSYSIHYTKLYE